MDCRRFLARHLLQAVGHTLFLEIDLAADALIGREAEVVQIFCRQFFRKRSVHRRSLQLYRHELSRKMALSPEAVRPYHLLA